MSDLLPFVVIGITFGSVYAIAGMGLVLTYKTSGVFNFAHGSIAAIAGYAFYEMRQLHGLPWPVAGVVCVLGVGPLLGVVFERLARTLGEQPLTMRIVATVGLLGGITGLVTVRYGSALIQVAPYLPTRNVRLVGVNFGVDQLITAAVALALAVGLYAFFRVSRLGLAMRAVVEDPSLVAIGGIITRSRPEVVLDPRLDLRGAVRGPPRTDLRPRGQRPHPGRRLLVRGRGHRSLLEPAPHLPRWDRDRDRRSAVDQVHR